MKKGMKMTSFSLSPLYLLFPASLPFGLFLSLKGSQRISDSEISDYDCEDGVGVITGNKQFKAILRRSSLCGVSESNPLHFTRAVLRFLIMYLANLTHVATGKMLTHVITSRSIGLRSCNPSANNSSSTVREQRAFLSASALLVAVLAKASAARPRCIRKAETELLTARENKTGEGEKKTEKCLKFAHMK